MGLVGARPLVHSRQFNGKQEGAWTTQHPCACAAPATVKRTAPSSGLASSYTATEGLEQAFGKADSVVFASPDTGQQGVWASRPKPFCPSTVGEGGEDAFR